MHTLRTRLLVAGFAAAILLGIATAHSASAITFVSSTPIAGDSVPVTVTLVDAPGGSGVDVTVSIPPGQGDLLGFFGNATPETLVPSMAVVDQAGLVTQWQFAANQVWKVGGGNVMSPVKSWDFGLRFASQGSAGGAVTSASFRLTAPGLTTASLVNAFNQGWRFGIRIQSTLGPEGSAKIGVASTALPVGEAPTIGITTPADGALLGNGSVIVSGTLTGTEPVTVSVNGIAATVTGSTWSAALALADGAHTLTATANNAAGSATDSVAVTVDTTPPVVTITAPADGTQTTAALVTVAGTVVDARPIASFTVSGVAVPLVDGAFTTAATLGLGGNPITAEATDAAGNTGSDGITVVRGEAPAIAITVPADGLLTNQTPLTVSGTVSGTAPVAVSVNGVAATVTGGSWTASVALVEGGNTLTASAANSFGSASAAVSVTLDTTAPVVAITAPASGVTLASQPAAVAGTVADVSSIAALLLNGSPLVVTSPFEGMAALVEGANVLVIEAVDAAGNTGSASVAVTYTPATPLAITIETPPGGALFSKAEVDVAGAVSDAAATVSVNGVLATVTGQQWVASRVPLSEGANTLTARATRSDATATAAVAVTYNAPPLVVITSPAAGSLFRTDATDVEGVVDDPSAFVDVNGIIASVGAGGRFLARGIPLAPGDNTLIARALDALGAKGSDSVAVVRDDAAMGRTRLVIPDGTRWNEPVLEAFTSFAEWAENLRNGNATGTFPRPFDIGVERFLPTPDVPTIFPQPQIFLLAENPSDVDFASFVGDETAPYRTQNAVTTFPIEDLDIFFPPEFVTLPSAFTPSDFEPRFFAVGDDLLVPCVPDGCPPGSIESGRVRLRATQDGVQREIALAADATRPNFEILSPSYGSVVAGNVVTVTGVVRDAGPLLDSVSYRVVDEFGIVVQEGLAPLLVEAVADPSPPFRGHFAIPDLVLAGGFYFVEVTAWDSLGNWWSFGTGFTIDAEAPAAVLYSPLDGSAFTESEVQASLDFAAPTTLVSVNGVPDGRSFPAGIAPNVLTLPLELGLNIFQLEIQNSAGAFSLSFTLHRVEAQGAVRIIAPVAGALVNSHSLTVTGTVPLGTPVVLVNGVLAAIAPDRVSFTATIPVPSTGIALIDHEVRTKPFAVTAEALPLGGRTSIAITPDFVAPSFRVALPEDGAVTSAASVALSGFVSEASTVSVDTPSGPLSVRTVRDRAREAAEPFNLFSAIQYHRYDLPPIDLAGGANAFTLRAVDAAGNETTRLVTLTRADASLALVSPAAGSSVADLVTSVTLHAAVPVTIDAFVVAGRQVPALSGVAIAAGIDTPVSGIPLVPGANDVRIVYHRAGSASEVLVFGLTSTATDFATVSGQVADQRTGEGIAGALVSITAGGVDITVVTDAQGHYVAQVSPGAIAITAAEEGYAIANASGNAAAGATLVADLGLGSTGIPAVMNELRILVPPAGTVTDFEMLTVVGTVLNPSSSVTVNGVPAQVVGNRFTAKHVPLAMGANTIAASASVLGLPVATKSVGVERSNTPVLQVKLFSPPDGATIPGGGLVVRGFVSAKDALVQVSGGGMAIPAEGVYKIPDVALPLDATQIEASVRTVDGAQSAFATSRIAVDRIGPALVLAADPVSGDAPLETELQLTATAPPIAVARIDFDLDGDGVLDVLASSSSTVSLTITEPTLRLARAFATTPSGVELSAPVALQAHLPTTTLRTFAVGNPVDLAAGADGALYVLDAAAGRITRYDEDGTALDAFGSSGAGSNQLANPQALAIDADGRFYVADTENDRVQVFSPTGAFEHSIGAGDLSGPSGVAVDGNLLIVSDTGAGRLRIFRLDGAPVASVPIANPRGIATRAAGGVLVTSPSEGLLAFASGVLTSIAAIESLPLEQRPVSPVDAVEGTDSTLVADASTGSVAVFWPSLQRRRVIQGMAGVKAVLAGQRREIESIYVADGRQVTEVGLPVPSPLPTITALKARLLALDIEGALEWISPERRAYFRDVYERSGPTLATEAAAMGSLEIDLLREGRAIALIHREEQGPTGPVDRQYPVQLVRSADGRWLVLDY